jgi:hypothetical protein
MLIEGGNINNDLFSSPAVLDRLGFFQLVSNKLLYRNDFNLNDPEEKMDLWHKKAGSTTAKPTYCYRKDTCPLRFPEYKSICCQNGVVQLDLPKQPEGPLWDLIRLFYSR